MAYRDFKLSIPIWDVSDDDEGDCPTIRSLFALLSVTPPDRSLACLYDSFYDFSAARYFGDPYGRIGRGDVLIFLSNTDDNSFIAIDMFDEATDQMNTIEIAISAPEYQADEVEQTMNSIRSSAEVASALFLGNLGLKDVFTIGNFPRLVRNHNTEVLQHAQVFRGGCRLGTSYGRQG